VAGVSALLLKSEHLNPTGSFKDRIASVGLSIAVERGLVGSVGTSSGNGGASAAAYGVRAGMPVGLFVLPDIAAQKLAQIRALGAGVWAVPELGQDAAGMERAAGVIAATGAEHGWFPMLTGGLYSPEAMEGANTIAFELVEQAPRATAVYVPVGGGGLLASIWHGYAESPEQLPGPAPRLVAVQPEGSATLRHALRGRAGRLDGGLTTSISGLQMAMLFDGDAAEAITATGGHLVEVGDEQILSAQRRLAREEGVLLEPAGAAALAGALADAAAGRLAAGDQVVLIGTGSGFKDVDALARLAGDDVVPSVLTEDIGRLLGTLVASCG
jgi:threonine synthase